MDYQFLAASQDAERQDIQQKLNAKAESERFFRQLAEAVPQMVWIVEPDGSLSYTNRQGSDFSGISQDGLPELQRLEVIHPEDRQTSLSRSKTHAVIGKYTARTSGKCRSTTWRMKESMVLSGKRA